MRRVACEFRNLTDTQPDPDVQIRELEWDFANRLERHTDLTTGEVTTYAYGPFGRRIRKAIVSGVTTWYLWDGDNLLAEYGSSGSRQVRYAYAGGFAPLQVAQGAPGSEAIYDVHTDHLDTPRMLTDSSGTPVWRAAYEAFGRAHVSDDPDGDPGTPDPQIAFNIRFPGQYYDAETGLHDNRFRYYDPSVGRYISADPIGQRGGVNVFAYVENNPVAWMDPWALKLRFKPGASSAFKKQFKEAIDYLNKGGASKVVADLEKESTIVYVEEATTPHDDSYDPATKTISWDPTSGLQCTTGGTQSPALGFLHEADHALGDVTGTAASTAPTGPPYDNAEEKRVITGSETTAATKLGEPTRTDHRGTPVRVKCPGCTK